LNSYTKSTTAFITESWVLMQRCIINQLVHHG